MTLEADPKNHVNQHVKKRWLLMRQPVLLTLSRLKVKAKMAMTSIMEMVEMKMVEMEMVKMEMVEMEIQMRIIGVLNSFALTGWNSHKRTVGTEATFSMSWRELIKLMAKVYCPRNEIKKMKSELWNLTVKNNDLATYT
ncbi:putative reverse transcriptase domain-containing protein [Tanacetum coccineum]